MSSTVIKTYVRTEEEFQAGRKNFINASEVGALLGFSQYQFPINIHLSKIGELVTEFKGNRLTKAGSDAEDRIAQNYKYWDHKNPDYEICLDNKLAGKKFNKVSKLNARYTNKKFPWLSCTPDRKIITAEGRKGLGELKNTTSMSTNKYLDGIDPCFFLQLQTQLLVTEQPYGEVIMFIDGNNMKVYPFEADLNVQEKIIERTKTFWVNVEYVRAIKQEYGIDKYYGINSDFIDSDMQDAVALLQSREPELLGTDNEFEWLKNNIKATDNLTTIIGTPEILDCLKQYLKDADMANISETARKKSQSRVLLAFGDAHKCDWENGFYATYAPDINGVRRLYITPKLQDQLRTPELVTE